MTSQPFMILMKIKQDEWAKLPPDAWHGAGVHEQGLLAHGELLAPQTGICPLPLGHLPAQSLLPCFGVSFQTPPLTEALLVRVARLPFLFSAQGSSHFATLYSLV